MSSLIEAGDAELLAAQGIEALRDLARSLQEEGVQKDARPLMVSRLASDLEAVDRLAYAQLLRPTEVEALFSACRLPAVGPQVDGLGRAIRGRAESMRDAQTAHLRLARPDEQAPALTTAVGAPSAWPKYPVPVGYNVTPGGIFRVNADGDTWVAGDPVLVTGHQVDIGTGQEHVELGFRRHGAWRTLVVPRVQARDQRQLVALADDGVPVSSGNSRDLVSWLDGCEHTGAGAIPVRRFTTRTGWHDDQYVAGSHSDLRLHDPEGDRDGWEQVGTWEGWCAALEEVEAEPVPWLILYAAAVGPLLRWLRLGHCPIVDLSGPRGRGKTTCLRLAGSGWGRADEAPGGTIRTWDASPTYMERLAEGTWDAPMLLDESHRAPRRDLVGQTLYALAQGRGKGRARPDGVRRTATWRNVVISTGEVPVIEATEKGGARARVLSVTRTPAISCRSVAQRLERGLATNYGHLGARLAQLAAGQGDQLRSRYLDFLEAWAAEVEADTRLLSSAAAIDVAAELVTELVGEPACDWRAQLAETLQLSVEEADQATRALDLVRGFWLSRQSSFARGPGDLEKTPPGHAWLGIQYADRVCLFPHVLEELLQENGHDVRPVVTRWRELGVLVANDGFKWKVRVRGRSEGLYTFDRAVVDG